MNPQGRVEETVSRSWAKDGDDAVGADKQQV